MVTHQPLLTLNWNLLFSLVTVVVLILILKKFFFEKVHNFMMDREQRIQDQLDSAQETETKAKELKDEYEKELEKAETEKRNIIASAKDEATSEADRIIQEAHIEATRIREENEIAIEQRKEEAKKELENEVSELAILAAQKILEGGTDGAASPDIDKDIVDAKDIPPIIDEPLQGDQRAIRRKMDELKIHMHQDDEE